VPLDRPSRHQMLAKWAYESGCTYAHSRNKNSVQAAAGNRQTRLRQGKATQAGWSKSSSPSSTTKRSWCATTRPLEMPQWRQTKLLVPWGSSWRLFTIKRPTWCLESGWSTRTWLPIHSAQKEHEFLAKKKHSAVSPSPLFSLTHPCWLFPLPMWKSKLV
jgi:hypothetical protein